ncbi:50S ribosomal protein L35 [bacterium]|nr:50S ribosomal protein L35 [bacterium]MCB2178971.1 50S ribosomal protein L35 [bacterium]
MPRKKSNKKYKLKTHKSTAKRFRVTGSGKIVRTKGGQSHFRRRRSARSKRQYSKMVPVSGAGYIKRIRRLSPYMNKYRTTPSARTAK